MAFSDRDGDLLLLLLLMLVAERDGAELQEFEPILDDTLRRLERDFERDDRVSSFPQSYFFHMLRRSLLRTNGLGGRSRLRYKIDQVYSHIAGRFDQLAGDLDRRFEAVKEELRKELQEWTNSRIAGRFDQLAGDLDHRFEAVLQERREEMQQWTTQLLRVLNQEETSKTIQKVSDSLKTLEWALSVGLSSAETKIERSIPIRIYLSDYYKASSDITSSVINSIVAGLESLAFERDIDLPEESGSWWKRLWMRTKDLATQEEIQERLIKIERVAETNLLDKPQAEANKDHATAVATIM